MSLEEKQEDIDNDTKNLQKQLSTSQERCVELIKRYTHTHTQTHFQHYNYDRVEKVVCLISSTSPILSDAEKTMARDLQSIHEQLNGLHRLLQKVPHPHLLLIMYTTPTSINNIHAHIYY